MWRITIKTGNAADRTAIVRFAATRVATVEVEDLDEQQAELDEDFAEVWLAERVLRHRTLGLPRTVEKMRTELRSCRLATMASITQLTLEQFLERVPIELRRSLVELIFIVMTENGVIFADDADPDGFLQDKLEPSTGMPYAYLWRGGVISLKMLPYLSAEFVRNIPGIKGIRLNSIRTLLGMRGLALKGESA